MYVTITNYIIYIFHINSDFDNQLLFLETLLMQEINLQSARIGFVEFSTTVTTIDVQFWEENALLQYVRNIQYDSMYKKICIFLYIY